MYSRTGCPALVAISLLFIATAIQAQQTPETSPEPEALPAVAAPDKPAVSVTYTGASQGFVPLFKTPASLQNSIIYQSNGRIGINRIPAATLDVGGTANFSGLLNLSRSDNASRLKGAASFPLRFSAQVYNSRSNALVNSYFEFEAEPEGNNSASPGITLNLLFASTGGVTANETGFYINSSGTVHFAKGQTFPGASTVPGPVGPAGPAGPEGRTGATGPAGPSGSFSLPRSMSVNGEGGYLLNLTNTGTKGGGGIFASGETGVAEGSNEVTFAGAGVTGRGGVAAHNAFAAGGTGLAGTGGTSSTSESSTGGTGVTGIGGKGISNTSKGGVGGAFTGGSSAQGAGNGINAIGGDGNVAVQGGNGIYAQVGKNGRYAGEFKGDVVVFGNIYKSGGSFKIDDPEDPANKYLSHSFVESPDMMNLYNGNVITDANGDAVIELPSWFEALNRDFRYQLTPIGQFAQAMVANEISNGRFSIKTDKPNVKISWLVTGVRQDAWANAHRIPVEQEKSAAEKGHFLHPELFGHNADQSLADPNSSSPPARQ